MRLLTQRYVVVLLLIAMIAVVLTPSVAVGLAADKDNLSDTGANKQTVRRVFNEQTGTLNFVGLPANSNVQVLNSTDGLAALQPYMNGFGLTDVNAELYYVNAHELLDGATVYRYQQVYNGVPVFLGELVVSGNRFGKLNAISGEVSPNLADKQLTTVPVFSSVEATHSALEYTTKYHPDMVFSVDGEPQLWVYDSSLLLPYNEPIELVWEVKLLSENHDYFYSILVSATRGGIRFSANLNAGQSLGNAEPSGNSEYASVSPDNPPTPLLAAPNHNLTIRTYDSNSTSDTQGAGGSALVCTTAQPGDPTPTLTGADSCDGGGSVTDANAAHFFAVQAANFFDEQFGLNSYDSGGSEIISNVDWCDLCPSASSVAFWDPSISQMIYGDDGFLTTDEHAGRNFIHAVISSANGAGFYNYYESGALYNAYGHVFGEFFDLYNGIDSFGVTETSTNDWKFGEDSTAGIVADFSDPPIFSHPDTMQSTDYFRIQGAIYQPDGGNINEGQNGGIFINVGVANKAAYLMTNGGSFNGQTVTAIGSTLPDSVLLASRIWFDAQFLLTSGSDYGQLYEALNTSCTNLVGISIPNTGETLTAGDCTQVNNALLAVEMNLEPELGPDYLNYSPEADITCTTPGATPVDLFSEGFEGGSPAVTVVHVTGGAPNWNLDTFYTHTGNSAYYGVDVTGGTDHYVTLQSNVTLTGSAASEYYLHFSHAYGFENDNTTANFNAFDGAVLEYTTDVGPTPTWTDAQGLFDAGQDYHPTQKINSGTNPLNGRDAFVWDSHGYVDSRYDLSSLAGQPVNFAWRMGTNGTVADLGWFLDNITIYACTGGVTVTPSNTSSSPGPGNDLFSNAVTVPSLPTQFNVDIFNSTTSLDDPVLWCASGPVSNTVWYSYVATGDFYFKVNTNGSAYDTVLGVYTGTQGALNNVACDNDGGQGGIASLVGLSTAPGVTYYIMVANNSGTPVGESTNLILNLDQEPNHGGVALFNPATSETSILSSLSDNPLPSVYLDYTNTPPATNQNHWVMGDWDGDGVDTPGVHANGPFYFTNDIGPSASWSVIWLGFVDQNKPLVVGRMNPGFSNDCIGIINNSVKPNGDDIFAVYFWCDMNTAPGPGDLFNSRQFLGAILANSTGRVGTFQFAAGDWDADGVYEMAVRRGEFITYSLINPSSGPAIFPSAQKWGTPAGQGFDDGQFVSGNWNGTAEYGWGVVYEENIFYYRNSLVWNPGVGVYNVQNFANQVNGTYQPFVHDRARGGAGPAAPVVASPNNSDSSTTNPNPVATSPSLAPATSTPISVSGIMPTATEVIPTATEIPPSDTSVPPTATEIPPSETSPPTATDIPSTEVPPTTTEIPPTATEVTPTETEIPPSVTPEPTETPEPVRLPIVEPMDDGAPRWTATGSWELTGDASYNTGGLGWMTAQTNEEATLQFNHPIILGDVAFPNLRFQSNLSANQSVGQVEISIDGENWLPIYIVSPSNGWEEQSVDLRDYRSMTIWLRFNWLSAPPSVGVEQKADLWMVDEVDVRNHPLETETPTTEPSPVSTEEGDPDPTTVPPAGVTPTNTPVPDVTQVGVGGGE